jgi:hypothetical protein
MPQAPRSSPIVYALYLNAALLCAILVVLFFRDASPSTLAFGQMQPSMAGGAGVFVMPAQFSKDTYGCYLLDVDAQTLAVYRFDPLDKQLRLTAARNFRYDRKLANFNTSVPSPMEVKEMLDKEAKGMHAATTQDSVSIPVSPTPATGN